MTSNFVPKFTYKKKQQTKMIIPNIYIYPIRTSQYVKIKSFFKSKNNIQQYIQLFFSSQTHRHIHLSLHLTNITWKNKQKSS